MGYGTFQYNSGFPYFYRNHPDSTTAFSGIDIDVQYSLTRPWSFDLGVLIGKSNFSVGDPADWTASGDHTVSLYHAGIIYTPFRFKLPESSNDVEISGTAGAAQFQGKEINSYEFFLGAIASLSLNQKFALNLQDRIYAQAGFNLNSMCFNVTYKF